MRAKKKIASAQQMIDAAGVSPEDFLYAIRQVLWIACVWNDHNFADDAIRESARLCAQRLGCEDVDKANKKLKVMLARVQEERNDEMGFKSESAKNPGEGVQTWLVFNALSDRDKWQMWRAFRGVWMCGACKAVLSDGPQEPEPFRGAEICCGECDAVLTRRTGGGQSNPFGWVLAPAEKTEKS